jgi:hypothetical protein
MLLGPTLSDSIKRGALLDQELDPLDVLREVVGAFEALGVAYAVGGSWASSVYGEPRLTRDADISVDPFPGRERDLADRFGSDYYLSVDAARSANRDRSSFNIIHSPTAYKVDVFVRKDDRFEQSVMARRTPGTTPEAPGSPLMWVSPEDIILLKLRWYRLGNEVSDRQWADVLGVLRTQAGRLEQTYMNDWADQLGVAELLVKAQSEAGA